MFPHGWSVDVVRMGGRDRDGDRLPSARHRLDDVAVAPVSTSERVEAVDQVDRIAFSARIYAKEGADLRAGDRVISRGVEYRVVGSPRFWPYVFSGKAGGIVADLEEVQSSGKV